MSSRRRFEDIIELSDDEEEVPTYRRLRRLDESSTSSEEEDGYDSIEDFIVPDEIMMDVDGEENAGYELERVLDVYRRRSSYQHIAKLETELGCKYSPEPVYDISPPTRRYDVPLYELGKEYYKLYDKNKTSWSTMNDAVAKKKEKAMQYYIYAAYCYKHSDMYERRWMIEDATSKSAGSELLTIYRVIDEHPYLLHFSCLTKTFLLRFK